MPSDKAFAELTICGIDELPSHANRGVTHVLSLLDPDLSDLESFQDYGEHSRTTLRFHDTIAADPVKTLPRLEDVEAILGYCSDATAEQGAHILIHCHMGVSRSTAAMLGLISQAHPQSDADWMFSELRRIRPQAWPNSLMVKYLDHLLGRRGELLLALRQHYGLQLQRYAHYASWMAVLGRAAEIDMAIANPSHEAPWAHREHPH